jgi:hypothetical protein
MLSALLTLLTVVSLASDKTSDHDKVVKKVGVGFQGIQAVQIGTDAEILAPIISVRRWSSSKQGLDLGIGLGGGGNAAKDEIGSETFETKGGGRFAVALHAGVPLALANDGHFSLQVVPETRLALAVGGVPAPEGSDPTSFGGFTGQLGVRVGGEVHFGFINIPRLSLEGGVGTYVGFRTGWSKTGGDRSNNFQWTLGTRQVNTPWDIFTGTVAARYYF